MNVKEMIDRLETIRKEQGDDVRVLIADAFNNPIYYFEVTSDSGKNPLRVKGADYVYYDTEDGIRDFILLA